MKPNLPATDQKKPPAANAVALSPKDAAERYGLSVPTLYRLGRRGDLRLSKVGARTLIRVADLDALLDRPAPPVGPARGVRQAA